MRDGNGAANGAVNGAAGARPGPAAPIAPFPPMKSGGNGGVARAHARVEPGPGPRGHGPNGALNGAGNGAAVDAEWVIARMEEAGAALLCLPAGGYTTRLRTNAWPVLGEAAEAYAGAPTRLRPPAPDAATISRMDEALSWLRLIPDDKYVVRRILASRMLVSPLTGRHLFPWRRLGGLVGADHKAVQRWHGDGVRMLVRGLGGKG